MIMLYHYLSPLSIILKTNCVQFIDILLKPSQKLIEINYFTSMVSNNPDKQKRQTLYTEALESVDINIFYGHYQSNPVECDRCGNIWQSYNKKMTDVNIATRMIMDAYKDRYDMAMLVSGDSDLVPPMREIHDNFEHKRVFVAFPPRRHNNPVAIVAKGSITIGKKISCQPIPRRSNELPRGRAPKYQMEFTTQTYKFPTQGSEY
jgi:hypothetical protein